MIRYRDIRFPTVSSWPINPSLYLSKNAGYSTSTSFSTPLSISLPYISCKNLARITFQTNLSDSGRSDISCRFRRFLQDTCKNNALSSKILEVKSDRFLQKMYGSSTRAIHLIRKLEGFTSRSLFSFRLTSHALVFFNWLLHLR